MIKSILISQIIASHSNPFQPSDDNDDDDMPPEMSASYSEISFHGVPESYEKSILDSSADYLDDTAKTPRPSTLGYGKRERM